MSKWFRIIAVTIAGVTLLAACAAPPDIKPLEDKVAALEGDVTALEGQVGGISALQGKVTALEGQVGALTLTPTERTFYVTGLEYKGSTTTDKLAAPSADPAKMSDGYRYKGPGYDEAAPTKWEVSTYRFEPGTMMGYEGDTFNLITFIVNGDKHTVWVEAPDGSEAAASVEMNRGREYTVTFTADQSGVYILHCDEHEPTMAAYILVLPRP